MFLARSDLPRARDALRLTESPDLTLKERKAFKRVKAAFPDNTVH